VPGRRDGIQLSSIRGHALIVPYRVVTRRLDVRVYAGTPIPCGRLEVPARVIRTHSFAASRAFAVLQMSGRPFADFYAILWSWLWR